MSKLLTLFIAALGILLSGCSTTAQQYAGSRENMEASRHFQGVPVGVDNFSDNPSSDNKNPLTLRGINSLTSPYGASYADYIEYAVKQDLSLGGGYSGNSRLKISGTLRRNDIDVGMSVGIGVCEVDFVLRDGSETIFKKTFSEKHQWESSFAAATAIPKAINEYPVMIQKLINRLFVDVEFLAKIKASEKR